MRQILKFLIFCSLLSSPAYAAISEAEELVYAQRKPAIHPSHIAEYVVLWAERNLPHTGILTEGKDGFVYVKVDDGYIRKLYPLLENRAYTEPPYFRRSNAPGAHISVFYANERAHTGPITEIGQQYSFKIHGLKSVPPKTHEYVVLEVSSPALEELRQKYGLKPLLQNHDFHITIAKKAPPRHSFSH